MDTHMFHTSDQQSLQGELHVADSPSLAVVITHPHPLMGGDMYSPVTEGFFRAMVESSTTTALRFNFRGVGRSTGAHDKGEAEQLDVMAAIDHVAHESPDVPIVLAGWSFGADVSLALDDERIAGWFLAAPPLSVIDPTAMAARSHHGPKVLAIGSNDQFNAPARAKELTTNWTNAAVQVIDDADHFFGTHLPHLVTEFARFVAQLDPGHTQ